MLFRYTEQGTLSKSLQIMHTRRMCMIRLQMLCWFHFEFTFPCNLHKEDILAKLLHYYICLCMHQYCRQSKSKNEKESQDLRKMSKLV